jgi:hypothetical protein
LTVGFAVGLTVGFTVGLTVGFTVGFGEAVAVGVGVGVAVAVGVGVTGAAGGAGTEWLAADGELLPTEFRANTSTLYVWPADIGVKLQNNAVVAAQTVVPLTFTSYPVSVEPPSAVGADHEIIRSMPSGVSFN